MSGRAPKISFLRRCGCINHDIFTENGSRDFSLRSRTYFSTRKEFTELIRRGLVQERARDICTLCLSYAREKLTSPSETKTCHQSCSNLSLCDESKISGSDDNTNSNPESCSLDSQIPAGENLDHTVEMMDADNDVDENILVSRIKTITSDISKLKWDDLDECLKDALSALSCALGKTIRTSLDAERMTMARECSTFDNLISIDRREWYQQRNMLLKKFLEGCTGVDGNCNKEKKFNSCVHSIEQIMYTKNNNMVTSFAFQRNIISYLISKSRTVSTLMGCWESSGSYTKVTDLICSPSDPIVLPDNCDITITFDNEQKVGRHTGRLREGSKQSVSIITTVASIKTNPLSRVQFNNIPPKLVENPSLEDIIVAVNHLEDKYREYMQGYRATYLQDLFAAVIEEQKFNPVTGKMNDYVDAAITHEGKYLCRCGFISLAYFECCPSCSTNSSFFHIDHDKYSRIESCHMGEIPEVRNAEPFMVNPSSKENVKGILLGLHEQAVTSVGRKWLPIVCDGVPYVLAAQIQDSSKQCTVCLEIVANTCLEEHSQLHGGSTNAYTRPLKELIVRPGPGHIEMNMCRLLLTFLWVPLFEELSNSFGFRTPKAKLVFKNGVDHHRSRQVLEACMAALGKELVVPYIRYCVQVNSDPSCDGYTQWYEDQVTNPNYAFNYHVTFSYLLAFHLYNEAVRKNNGNAMMAARTIFAPLFYCSHHPKYQLLLLRDICERVNYSPEVAKYMTLTESFSVSGKDNAGQGGDFIHEEQNKLIKSFIPPVGVPSKETWRNIIRKTETLKEMKRKLLATSGINFSSLKRPKNFEHEITMIRRKIRKAAYFENYNDANAELVSISGKLLDDSLCDFNFVAQENYTMYKEELVTNGTYGTKKLEPVFITKEEREKYDSIESKTVDEIKSEICLLLDRMPDKDIASSQRDLFQSKKRQKKHQYISTYYECKDILEEQLAEKEQISTNGSEFDEEI